VASDYQLEMYEPAAKRRWRYFALPILCGDALVGKLDAAADRQAGVHLSARVHALRSHTRRPCLTRTSLPPAALIWSNATELQTGS
jgi:uncharacterized protein YcaQ